MGYMAVGLSRCGHWFFLSGFVLAVRLARWARWHGAGGLEGPAGAVGAFRRRLGRVFRPVLKVRVVGLRLMGVDFSGRRLGRPGGAPIKSR